ncbi:hypothetical protein GCM10009558_083300 [Virgisporangium aurantiacum]
MSASHDLSDGRRSRGDPAPDPTDVQTVAELAACAHKLMRWAERSTRQVSTRAARSGESIANTTVHNLIAGKNPPQPSTLKKFLLGCDLPIDQHQPWLDALRRLQPSKPAPTEPLGGPGWIWAGAEARGHFTRRGQGRRSGAQGGNLFRGRAVALDRIETWWQSAVCPGEPLVVVGQPGSGKSAVLGQAVLLAQSAGMGSGLAMHARGATVREVVAAVARLVGQPEAIDVADLVDWLAGRGEAPVWLIALDALDEAYSRSDQAAIAEFLTELAAVPWVRVVVATRPLAPGDRYMRGGLLARLRVSGPNCANEIDLDAPEFADTGGLITFASALLTQEGVTHPGPPGRAWARYREQPEAVRVKIFEAGFSGIH